MQMNIEFKEIFCLVQVMFKGGGRGITQPLIANIAPSSATVRGDEGHLNRIERY